MDTPRFYVMLDNHKYLGRTGFWVSMVGLAKEMSQREALDYIRDFGPMYGVKNLKMVSVCPRA